MYRLQCNFMVARRYGFLCLVLFGLFLKAEAVAGTWTSQASGTGSDLFSVHFVSATEGWAVGVNTILHTTDGGTVWTPQTSPLAIPLRGVRFTSPLNGWAGGGPGGFSGVIRTIDGGATWTDYGAAAATTRNNLFANTPTMAWSPNTGASGRFFSRYEDGQFEDASFDIVPPPDTDQHIDMYFVDADNGWAVGTAVAGNALITRIANASGPSGGVTFTPQTSGVAVTLNAIHMVDLNVGYIVGDGGTILKTPDGGANWFQLPPPSIPTVANLRSISCVSASSCWAVGDAGAIIQTTDGGTTWILYAAAVPAVQLNRVFMVSATVGYAVGNGGNIIKFTSPTAVTLESFTASADESGEVRLNWKTGYEVGNLGFNVYREQGGKRTRMTAQILAGSALLAGPETGLTAGASYEFSDEAQSGKGETRYWLEELDINGQSLWHGPARIDRLVQARKGKRNKTVLLSSLGSARRSSATPVESKARLQLMTRESMGIQSTLARQAAVKLFIKEEGWYRVSQEELLAAGLDARVDPRRLQLFVDGTEQSIVVRGEDDGSFDLADGVEFYGMGLESASSDTRTYWLAEGVQAGQRLPRAEAKGTRVSGHSFPYTVERRERTVYFSSLLNGEQENFFGAVVGKEPVDQSIDLPNLDATSSEQALIEVSLQGVTRGEHRVRVLLNGEELGGIEFDGKSQGRGRFLVSHGRLKETDNQIRLVAHASERDISLVDGIRVTYWHRYGADRDSLRFDLSAEEEVVIDGFSSGAIRVLDITDAADLQEIVGEVRRHDTGFAVRVAAPGRGTRRMLAFTESEMKRPDAIAGNKASSWRETTEGADLVIIAHSDFMDSVAPLRALRESQGLTVAVADLEDVYDEFSYGQKTPQAIKDFLQFARTSWQRAPRFVLFVGDASLDPMNYLGKGRLDFVPTKLIDTEFMETASDDWFADFAGEGLPEMAIGRLPVTTPEEADHMVGKIVSFEPTDWTGGALLVSDRDDEFDFKGASDELRALLPAGMVVEEFLRGDGTEKSKLLASLNRGKRIVNYLGHGSVGVWRGNLLTQADASELTNSDDLTVFIATTCLNGYFQEPGYDGLAESLMKAEGGACAVWASSGMTGPEEQVAVNKELFRLLFRGTSLERGRSLTLGEAVTVAKAAAENRDIRRTYLLFGDPTMKFR